MGRHRGAERLLMRHPIYNLEGKASFWGVAYGDWLMFIFAFGLSLRLLSFLPPRPKLLFGAVLTGLFAWYYISLKDRMQPRFYTHFANWSGEAEVYRVAPDPKNVPLMVDAKKVGGLMGSQHGKEGRVVRGR